MEAIVPFETLVYCQQSTLCYIPEDSTLRNNRCQNLESYKFKQVGLGGGSAVRMGEVRNAYKDLQSERSKARDHMDYLGVDMRIILKWILYNSVNVD
jgi:hypothetical protein